MPAPLYELKTICSTCGNVVGIKSVDEPTYRSLVMSDGSQPRDSELVTDALVGDETLDNLDPDRTAEVLVERVGNCPRCIS